MEECSCCAEDGAESRDLPSHLLKCFRYTPRRNQLEEELDDGTADDVAGEGRARSTNTLSEGILVAAAVLPSEPIFIIDSGRVSDSLRQVRDAGAERRGSAPELPSDW